MRADDRTDRDPASFDEGRTDLDLEALFRRTMPVPPAVDCDRLLTAFEQRSAARATIEGARPGRRPPVPRSVPVPLMNRRIRMFTKAAAVFLLATSVAAMSSLLWPGRTTAALSAVQEALEKATSATYTVTVAVDDGPGEEVKVMLLGPKICRAVHPDGTITILDLAQQKSVRLLPAEKKAVVADGLGVPDGFDVLGLLANLNRHPSRQQRVVPDLIFEGREAEAFVVELDEFVYNVWTDKATHLPLRLESGRTLVRRGKDGREHAQAIREVWSDFDFDAKLDESLFSLIPPDDYAVEKRAGGGGPDAVAAEKQKVLEEFEKANKAFAEAAKAR